ncbi:MAG: bifunctional riboflavin kinase/FAD synthetase [Anaerolineae bacterium]|nr:bifunctional riboflavin kinase/FAD synthetase [Anaerolineae bacterium]
MQHITSLDNVNLTRPSVVTIGSFDGVHRGHQYLVRHLVKHARETGHLPVVFTFYPHPRTVLGDVGPGFYLTLPDDKARLFTQMGVELVITQPFTEEFRRIRAAYFVDQLLTHLSMRALWVGADFALGYQREGDVEFLRKQGEEKGFSLKVVDLMDAGDERVSSSRIRHALELGHVAEAARLLGRKYSIFGEVVPGDGRGRTLGFPTANLSISPELCLPSRGVYVAWADVADSRYTAVVNIGTRPTFDSDQEQTVEAHLLDYSGSLYDETVYLHFLARLREERKFDSVDALTTQIRTDITQAKQIIANRNM